MLRIHNDKQKAAALLIDPSSAQFRDVHMTEDGWTVCGEINGKNRYGAYVGFTRFVVTGTGWAILQPERSEAGDDLAQSIWVNHSKKCNW